MLTLTKTDTQLRIIPFSTFDRPITYRMVDEEGSLIAKINGHSNVPLVQEMILAHRDLSRVADMENYLKGRLMDLLANLDGIYPFVVMIREAAIKGNGEALIALLKDQYLDATDELKKMIGKEAFEIISLL